MFDRNRTLTSILSRSTARGGNVGSYLAIISARFRMLLQYRAAALASAASAGAFVVALFCALLLGCAITTLINISLLWTIAGEGVAVTVAATVSFLSGMIIPLPLFPRWCFAIIQWLPFAGLVDLPFRIYTANIPTDQIFLVIARQIVWTAILVLLGRWLLARGMRRIVIQGGWSMNSLA